MAGGSNSNQKCTSCSDSDLVVEIRLLSQELKEMKLALKLGAGSRWSDIKEACKYTSLSESTLSRAVSTGKLKCSKTTGKMLFKVAWIERFLGNGK